MSLSVRLQSLVSSSKATRDAIFWSCTRGGCANLSPLWSDIMLAGIYLQFSGQIGDIALLKCSGSIQPLRRAPHAGVGRCVAGSFLCKPRLYSTPGTWGGGAKNSCTLLLFRNGTRLTPFSKMLFSCKHGLCLNMRIAGVSNMTNVPRFEASM